MKLAQPFRELVYYHYEKDGNDYWMFFNESISEEVDTKVSIPSYPGKNGYAFDAYHNQVKELEVSQEGIALKLAPYETIVWVFTDEKMPATTGEPQKESERKPIEAEWEVSFAGALAYPTFESVTTLKNGIQALSDLEGYDRAAGTVAYETQLEVNNANPSSAWIWAWFMKSPKSSLTAKALAPKLRRHMFSTRKTASAKARTPCASK